MNVCKLINLILSLWVGRAIHIPRTLYRVSRGSRIIANVIITFTRWVCLGLFAGMLNKF